MMSDLNLHRKTSLAHVRWLFDLMLTTYEPTTHTHTHTYQRNKYFHSDIGKMLSSLKIHKKQRLKKQNANMIMLNGSH